MRMVGQATDEVVRTNLGIASVYKSGSVIELGVSKFSLDNMLLRQEELAQSDFHSRIEVIDLTDKVLIANTNISSENVSMGISALNQGIFMQKWYKCDAFVAFFDLLHRNNSGS
ncbi:hypothetical protein N6H18_18095 [Reichenbachiella agarivorans]|uniref:Uncharacterized protein n=1 Tax=Reichenbachiella agarivorans TaxID=2979464 RepID=A0ABY6CP06_9BACT|nr:hypothetical protein [Reichenbachiella agarivorans]UXP32253.1 hypothetical protein N6H18_18095 [Reichenbachiella agarivorans]